MAGPLLTGPREPQRLERAGLPRALRWQRVIRAPQHTARRKGARLSTRAIDLVIRGLARDADLVLSAHTLRHTCLTRLVRGGADVVLVAELAGHRRPETTRRYSLPSQADRQDAMERLRDDY